MLACNWRLVATVALFCTLSLLSAPAEAQITVTGTVTPANPATWTWRTQACIGTFSFAPGTVTVAGGSTMTSGSATLGLDAGSSGTVTVTGTGSKWASGQTSNDTLIVGQDGTGQLKVLSGATVTSMATVVGQQSDSMGYVTVSGAGSTWHCDDYYNSLTLGQNGVGTLSVTSGGTVYSSTVYLGYNIGGTGTASVTGTGSSWTCTSLYMGGSDTWGGGTGGTGTLTVGIGATVTTRSLYASANDLHGKGTINTKGLVADDMDLIFDATHGTSQGLPFGAGGVLTLNLSGTGNGDLGAGYRGTGSLRIADGVRITSAFSCLGYNPGSSGTATVTGSGSTWTNSGLHVGEHGTGTLTVSNGGKVSSSTAFGEIGYFSGSNGTVVVTGPGSSWNNSNDLGVGYSGTGTLKVEAGGKVSSGSEAILGNNLGSSGTAVITGPGSNWTCGRLYVGGRYTPTGGTGSLTVANGGAVGSYSCSIGTGAGSNGTATVIGAGSSWNSGILYVGCSGGVGALSVADGGTISSPTGYIGYDAGSSGDATVTGPNSTWTNSGTLYVGYNGAGTLTVENGGAVTTSTLYASLDDLKGDGTITTKGLVADMDLVFDATAGANPVFSFGTGGRLNVNLDGTGELGVGHRGTGSLRIADGVNITSSSGYLGFQAGSSGMATVTGSGSTWTINSALDVGWDGAGALTVTKGGTVNCLGSWVGSYEGSSGTATITGAGSTWNSGGLSVGVFSAGTIKVENGGAVNSSAACVGFEGTHGTVVVTGPGSSWTITNALYGYERGGFGDFAVTVGGGGKVTAGRLEESLTVNLHVSGNGMFVLGSATTAGIINHYAGHINFYADAFLAAATYSPITEYAGRPIYWAGDFGSNYGYGGAWDDTAKTFTVAAATASTSGVSNTLTTGERLLITDSGTGKRVGASFGTVAGGTNFQADLLSGGSLSGLPGDQNVLGAWNFTTNFIGDQALLSFEVGAGWSDLAVWHYDGTAWTSFAAPDLTYGDDGIANFAVTGFGSYALAGILPAPAVPHPGDANNDGAVDVVDLGILARNYDTAAGMDWTLGDFNKDGSVDVIDLGILARNYDWSATPAGSVPEPATLSLLALGGVALLRRRG